ncbi:hypothetical protein EIP86_006089 [Pleurotus ostreatoroseus]|nr:hypothetical protein EIP86_006089 [Pleurotus ostreatoroseus]
MDGQNVGPFTRDTTGQNDYEYNVPVYVNQSIPFGNHTFMLQNGHTGGQAALALFDYVVITTEDDSPGPTSSAFTSTGGTASTPLTAVTSASTSAPLQNTNSAQDISTTQGAAASSPTAPQGTTSSSHTRTIAVAVVCSIAGVLLLVGGVLVYRRKRGGTPVYDNEFGGVDPYRLPPVSGAEVQVTTVNNTHMQQQSLHVSQDKLVDMDTDVSPPPYE